MAKRKNKKQSIHDQIVKSYGKKMSKKGRDVVTNPGNDKNKDWSGHYIDVVAMDSNDSSKAVIIEVETADSVSESEAKDQWKKYDNSYDPWFLAVPNSAEKEAKKLVDSYNLGSCRVITWKLNGGSIEFSYMPG